MTLKPPTRTLPRLVMKDWPGKLGALSSTTIEGDWLSGDFTVADTPLSDFTRVGEGVQERPQNEKPPSNED